MAHRIIWTETAANDLRAIVRYISLDNPEAARRIAQKVLARIDAAAALPHAGRMVPEREDPTVREVLLNPYRIIYSLDDSREAIYVARIWHAARGTPFIH